MLTNGVSSRIQSTKVSAHVCTHLKLALGRYEDKIKLSEASRCFAANIELYFLAANSGKEKQHNNKTVNLF